MPEIHMSLHTNSVSSNLILLSLCIDTLNYSVFALVRKAFLLHSKSCKVNFRIVLLCREYLCILNVFKFYHERNNEKILPVKHTFFGAQLSKICSSSSNRIYKQRFFLRLIMIAIITLL